MAIICAEMLPQIVSTKQISITLCSFHIKKKTTGNVATISSCTFEKQRLQPHLSASLSLSLSYQSPSSGLSLSVYLSN